MTAPLSLNAQARDLRIDLRDSCNCCCFGKPINPGTPVYINDDGIVVKFDIKKAVDERRAMKKSLSNLERHIERISIQMQKDKEEMKQEIERRVGLELNSDPPSPVTLSLAFRINEAIKDVFGTKDS